MKNLTKSLFGSMVLAGIGLVSSVGQAEAAALKGVLAFSAGTNGGVNIEYTGFDDAEGDPLTTLDFLPKLGGGGASGADNGFALIEDGGGVGGDFLAFAGEQGLIKDLGVSPDFITAPPVAQFLDFASFDFELTDLDTPVYAETGTTFKSTTITIGIKGIFTNLAGEESTALGTLNAQFAGLSADQTRALIKSKPIGSGGIDLSWSGILEARPGVTPEPSALVGLVAVGLIAAKATSRKSSKKV